MHTKPNFIEHRAQLQTACRRWIALDAIALDTEFERTRTYYPRPALIQIFDAERVTIIDPLGIDDFAPLAELLQCPGITKVMHAAEGDIEILEQLAGVTPNPVFDTQLAAAFAGHGFSLGYRTLVERLLGERIAKDETRSDWLKRPLSDAQIAYAALDVLHLLPMYRILKNTLVELGREAWLREEIERIQRRRDADRDPRRAYQRIRSAGRLDATERAALRELAAWRELEARKRDVPRQAILDDAVMIDLAAALPADESALAAIPALAQAARSRYADSLLERVARARSAPADAEPSTESAMEPRYTPRLKVLKQIVREQAEALGIPAPLLAQSRILESLVQAAASGKAALPEELRGWRQAIIGTPLLRALETMDDQT
ncbi:MAG: ribonuclease D [Gammaproteobacteria bacterium]|nr:ribonuclease D [Gammaproteobacteria bacterium]NIM73800.1 ribonuclease D [Gammaproteobacteria bacterium]NIN39377.1 ribonuclease D [Gammaproteobacteria bacterium]NIO25042.1 ribonuclease D [Gammaproteobacteria bacterium]NIO65674.1 ribonuclease D [Gammaproteobacteria bacterium]